MSARRLNGVAGARQQRFHAPVFAALGDETRLSLVAKLCGAEPQSISQLTEEFKVTRQAITRHLSVLEEAGIVRGVRSGRERLFALETEPLIRVREYLDVVSRQWDEKLTRLKMFVEK